MRARILGARVQRAYVLGARVLIGSDIIASLIDCLRRRAPLSGVDIAIVNRAGNARRLIGSGLLIPRVVHRAVRCVFVLTQIQLIVDPVGLVDVAARLSRIGVPDIQDI